LDDVVVFEAVIWQQDREWWLDVDGVVQLHGHDRYRLREDARAIIALELGVDTSEVDVFMRSIRGALAA
jgi:hypothetical protein